MAEPGRQSTEPHFVRTYAEHTRRLLESWGSPEGALQAAVGSATPEEFEMVGRMEKLLLVYAGLHRDDFLVDIGCGSGRLAVQLAGWLRGPYLGTDVVESLLRRAADTCNRPDWRFERVSGLTVPVDSETVDMACAFSVFTHLRHEESYVYMQDVYRVLKPGARLVFSFLEFRVPELWQVLEGNVESIGEETVLNQFMSVDAVEAFAGHLGFQLLEVHRGDEPFIPFAAPTDETGSRGSTGLADPVDRADPTEEPRGTGGGVELRSFGQSVAIYRKPLGSSPT